MVLTVTLVENPAWRPDLDGERAFPRKVPALVNVRESAIATLAARKDRHGRPLIDAAQVAAADRVRRLWEALGGAGARAIDYTREPVDGGHIADPIKVGQLMAGKQLEQAHRRLGSLNYRLVCRVCGEGMALRDLYASKRQRLVAADNLRSSLDLLCLMWGISVAGPTMPSRRYWRNQHAAR